VTTTNVGVALLDGEGNKRSFLDIGHFGADRGEVELTGYTAAGDLINGAGGVFIDTDPDRFVVRINDASKNQNPGVRETIRASLATLVSNNAGAAVDDDETEFELLETEPDSGVFVSEAMLLTSPDLPLADNPDDDMAVWSTREGAFFVADDALNDRTHRATIDGAVRVKYEFKEGEFLPSPTPVSERSPDARKTLRVRVRVHMEPYNDVGVQQTALSNAGKLDSEGNLLPDHQFVGLKAEGGVIKTKTTYTFDPTVFKTGENDGWFTFLDEPSAKGDPPNGVHDPGEISEPYLDMSTRRRTSTDMARGDQNENSIGDGWNRITPDSFIQAQIQRADLAWAQAGIHVVQFGPTLLEHPPADDNPTNDPWKTIIHDGVFNADEHGNGPEVFSQVEQIGDAATPDVLEVVFTTTIDDANAVTSRPGRHIGTGFPAAFVENTYVFIGADPLADDASTPSILDIRFRTMAHEIGHALTNRSDTVGIDTTSYIFFPSVNTLSDDEPNRRRRIQHETEGAARTPRAKGDFEGPGNRLLIQQ